jgi:hypothetical protein
MAGITWLHLSDWHQGSEAFAQFQESEAFDRSFVGERLKEDILNRTSISPDLAKIDFFVFSGDVAFSGQEAEYQAAIEQLFTPMLAATGLSEDKLFIIPGNHDIDRKKFRFLPLELTRPFNSEAEVKVWLNVNNREHILKPFAAYDLFIKNYTKQKNTNYASTYNLEIDGIKVAFLGLNSALMCGRNKIIRDGKEEVNDYGNLIVGEPQLFDGLKELGDADVFIAVLHHPFEWLTTFDRFNIKEQLGENFHFILSGHEHFPEINMIEGTMGHCLVIPAGAGFDKRVPDNPIYTNAYNFVHIDFDTGQITIYLRCWNNRKSKFDKDTNVYSSGQKSFPLPKQLNLLFQRFVPSRSTSTNETTVASDLKEDRGQVIELSEQDINSSSITPIAQHISPVTIHIENEQIFSPTISSVQPQNSVSLTGTIEPLKPSLEYKQQAPINLYKNYPELVPQNLSPEEEALEKAREYIEQARNAVQNAQKPFEGIGNFRPTHYMETVNALNLTNTYMFKLKELLTIKHLPEDIAPSSDQLILEVDIVIALINAENFDDQQQYARLLTLDVKKYLTSFLQKLDELDRRIQGQDLLL